MECLRPRVHLCAQTQVRIRKSSCGCTESLDVSHDYFSNKSGEIMLIMCVLAQNIMHYSKDNHIQIISCNLGTSSMAHAYVHTRLLFKSM